MKVKSGPQATNGFQNRLYASRETEMESDKDYFANRAEEERFAAKQADDKRARSAHLELADGYEQLSDALEEAHRPTLV